MVAHAARALVAASIILSIVLVSVSSAPAAGPGCLAQPDTDERERLLSRLAAAETAAAADIAADALWRFWHRAPTLEAQALLDRVHDRRRWYDLEAAEAAALALTELCPDYAEGWNQLATALFLREKFDASLLAIERTLELEPAHFGALAGRSEILRRRGDTAEAQIALRRAAAVHPFLIGREMLVPEAE